MQISTKQFITSTMFCFLVTQSTTTHAMMDNLLNLKMPSIDKQTAIIGSFAAAGVIVIGVGGYAIHTLHKNIKKQNEEIKKLNEEIKKINTGTAQTLSANMATKLDKTSAELQLKIHDQRLVEQENQLRAIRTEHYNCRNSISTCETNTVQLEKEVAELKQQMGEHGKSIGAFRRALNNMQRQKTSEAKKPHNSPKKLKDSEASVNTDMSADQTADDKNDKEQAEIKAHFADTIFE
jgi:chromosome segregation ATPase